MESLKEATSTFYSLPGAANTFPIDPRGLNKMSFGDKSYQCKDHVLAFSTVLTELVSQDPKGDISQVLTHAESEEALDTLMKLISGIGEVVIPKKRVCSILLFPRRIKNYPGRKGFHTKLFEQVSFRA